MKKFFVRANAWKNKDFKTYIDQYSKSEFHNPNKGNWRQFRKYKRAIFSRTEKPRIDFRNMSILVHDDYAVVTMEQDYESKLIKDIGKKTLYLKKDSNYDWKIVAEQWSKIDEQNRLAFVPAMRFFPNKGEALADNPARNTSSNIEEN